MLRVKQTGNKQQSDIQYGWEHGACCSVRKPTSNNNSFIIHQRKRTITIFLA